MDKVEYSASQIRRFLQQLFPHRRLVLSQFTFFNQIGVAVATGETSRRGRQCYRLQDVLSIATVLALKEEGIALKNVGCVPTLVQTYTKEIFEIGQGCKLSGFGETVSINIPGIIEDNNAINRFLVESSDPKLFWTYDVGVLATQLVDIAEGRELPRVEEQQAA